MRSHDDCGGYADRHCVRDRQDCARLAGCREAGSAMLLNYRESLQQVVAKSLLTLLSESAPDRSNLTTEARFPGERAFKGYADLGVGLPGAIRCKAPRHRWHSRQPWHCRICNLQILKELTEFEAHPLRQLLILYFQ